MASPAKKTALGTSTSSPAMAVQTSSPAHELFQRVYTHLKEGRLKSAQDLLNQADATTHGQLPGNKKTIYEFISKEGLSDDTRASNLIKILKKSKLFPEVYHDDFEKNRMCALLSSAVARINIPKMETTHAEILKEVRAFGVESGLTEDQVNSALEEVVLDDGSRVWMVKAEHDSLFKAWEDSLRGLAVKEESALFCESEPRDNTFEYMSCLRNGFNSRGLYRGIETQKSAFKMSLLHLFLFLFEEYSLEETNIVSLAPHIHHVVVFCKITPFATDCLKELAKTSKFASIILKILQTKVTNDTSIVELKQISLSLAISDPEIGTWIDFVSAMLSLSYRDSSQDAQKAIGDWIQNSSQFFKDPNSKNREAVLKAHKGVIDAIRNPRDREYAKIFLEERPNIPKGKLAFVFFGANHGPGFKQALLEQHRGLEKKKPLENKKTDSDKTPLASSTSEPTENKSKEEKKKKRRG